MSPFRLFSTPLLGTPLQIFAAILLGVAGFALNFLILDLGWGLQFLMGGAVALLSLRTLPPACIILSVAIAAGTTLFHWQHPWALLIWLFEGAVLATFVRRASPILVDFLFWLLLGGPLVYATYGALLGFQEQAVLLVIAKQALNGLLNIWIAELLYVALLTIVPLARRLRLEAIPASHLAMMALTSLALVPLPFHLWISAAGDAKVLINTQSSELEAEVSLLQRRTRSFFQIRASGLQILASNAIATGASHLLPKGLGPFTTNFDSIVVRDYLGRVLASYETDNYSGLALAGFVGPPLANSEWVVETKKIDPPGIGYHFVVVASVDDGKAEVLGNIPQLDLMRCFGSYRPERGTTLAIVNPQGLVATGGAGDLSGLQLALAKLQDSGRAEQFSRPEIFTPTGFGKSLMSHMSASSIVYQASLGVADGWRIVAARSLKSVVTAARDAQLNTLAIHWAFLSLSIVAAAVASRSFAGHLQSVQGLLSRIVASSGGASVQVGPVAIRELNEIREKADQLGGTISSERSELATYQERLLAVEAHAPIVLYGVTIADGRKSAVRFVSASVSRVVGYSREEVSAPGWWPHGIHPDEIDDTLRKFRDLKDGQTVTAEYRFRHKSGEYRWIYDVLVVTHGGADGEKVSGVGFVVDITPRKQAEQQLAQAVKLASLGEMATGMAHELSQPLNVIKLTASTLSGRLRAGGIAPEEATRQLSTMVQQLDRAAKLIVHLRAFGRVPSEAPARFDLSVAIEGARFLVTPALATDRIDLEVEILADSAIAKGHSTLFEQVLVNLILNARDAIRQRQARETGLKGMIVVTLQRLPEQRFSIVVDDNGTGIPANVLEHLFEPFFTTKSVGKGTGLGLSVSYGIIRSMNGTIEGRSTGMGARFEIVLPEEYAPISNVA